MNYKKIYENLIDRAKKRIKDDNEYYEMHHIIPRSIGGEDNKDNIAYLTLREHYLAHELLVRIYPESYKLANALWMMTITTIGSLNNFLEHQNDTGFTKRMRHYDISPNKLHISSHQYEYARSLWIKFSKGRKRTEEQCMNISKKTKEAMHRPDVIKKCKANIGVRFYYHKDTHKILRVPKDSNIKIDESIYIKGRPPLSDERKKRLSETQLLNKTLCKIGETDYRYVWYKDYVKCIPDIFKDLHVKQKNSLHKVSNVIYDALDILKQQGFFYDDIIVIRDKKRPGLHIISPSVYEVIYEDLLNHETIENITARIHDNIDRIIELNRKYV